MRTSLINEVTRLVRSNEELSKQVAALQTEVRVLCYNALEPNL